MQPNNQKPQEEGQQKLSAIEDIIKNNYAEAAELKAAGFNPYPAHVEPKHTCLEAKESDVDA